VISKASLAWTPTRVLLVETAERLLAERGVHGVSLREIGVEAGQRNTGAVRYHFGTKELLVAAVFEYRMTRINERRLAILARLEREGRALEMRGLAEAFLFPLAEMLGEIGRPSWYLRFCIHAAYVEGAPPEDLNRHSFTLGAAIVRDRYEQLMVAADVPEGLRAERYSLFTGHIAHALADRELMLQRAPQRIHSPRAVFLANLLDTAVGLADAPISKQTNQQIDDRRSA
jgi:AcrR family transcriptional regulator